MNSENNMTLSEYIQQLRRTQQKLIENQEFEVCAEVERLIVSIENKDLETFMHMCFYLEEMKKTGFLKKDTSLEEDAEQIRSFFGIDSIYDYVIREGLWCSYERYANGIYDIIKKVEF